MGLSGIVGVVGVVGAVRRSIGEGRAFCLSAHSLCDAGSMSARDEWTAVRNHASLDGVFGALERRRQHWPLHWRPVLESIHDGLLGQ